MAQDDVAIVDNHQSCDDIIMHAVITTHIGTTHTLLHKQINMPADRHWSDTCKAHPIKGTLQEVLYAPKSDTLSGDSWYSQINKWSINCEVYLQLEISNSHNKGVMSLAGL
jgi:hypothetical protein